MSNTAWYICLAAIFTGVGISAVYSARRTHKVSTLVMFYLFTTSITWIGEFVVLGIFNSYAYKPGISNDPWLENLAGHLFLNVSMFPAAAILAVTRKLGYTGYSLLIAAFLLPEYLFVKLGIYEQHWWKYYMSVINTVLFLIISKAWFRRINPAKYDFSRLITLYFISFLINHITSPLLLLLHKQHYSLGLINNLTGNIYRSSIIIVFSYHLVESIIWVYFVCIPDKWYWKLVPYAVIAAGQSIMHKMNILTLEDQWKLVYTILLHSVAFAIFVILERYTLKPD